MAVCGVCDDTGWLLGEECPLSDCHCDVEEVSLAPSGSMSEWHDSGCDGWQEVGVCTERGSRDQNEDRYLLLRDWRPVEQWPNSSIYAIFDGHGGDEVADRCRSLLPEYLKTEFQREVDAAVCWRSEEGRRVAVQCAFQALDSRLRAEGLGETCGSTCVLAIVWPEVPGQSRVLFANLGDSRALVICGICAGRDSLSPGDLVLETIDHKPELPAEITRICRAGGFVKRNRVDGKLAMSRAFGDFYLKPCQSRPSCEWKVSCTPGVGEYSCCCSDLILLASDGVFDVLPSWKVAKLAFDTWMTSGSEDVDCVATEVVATAYRRKSQDNATCIVFYQHSTPLGFVPFCDITGEEQTQLEFERELSLEERRKAFNHSLWQELSDADTRDLLMIPSKMIVMLSQSENFKIAYRKPVNFFLDIIIPGPVTQRYHVLDPECKQQLAARCSAMMQLSFITEQYRRILAECHRELEDSVDRRTLDA